MAKGFGVTKHFVRWGWLATLLCGLGPTVVSCGSNREGSTFDGGQNTDSSVTDDGSDDSGEGGMIFTNPTDGGDAAGGGVCRSCADLGYTCGMNGDGCGHVLDCGTCTKPDYCGGAGFSKCGSGAATTADGAPVCTPTTCADLGYNCGPAGNGCGLQLDCGTCTAPAFCGGGGFSKCGTIAGQDGGSSCKAETCASLGYTCGAAGDGCGGSLSCGATCPGTEFCGGGGFNKCGGSTAPDAGTKCTPTTCAAKGYTCGYAADGCGGLLDCWPAGTTSCTAPEFCGGGGYDVCGPSATGGCTGATTTSITGYVYDPGNNLPVYNALVYIPVGAVQTPQTGVNPAVCACSAPPAYASAFTAIDGSFTLTNVPKGTSATVVVQLGKWQRVFPETITPCMPNALPAHLTLPSTHLEGHIPLFAIDTGKVDTMECVLLKMGIAQTEFVDPVIVGGVPTAAERIHMYQGSAVAGGAIIDGNTPTEAALTESASVMDSYDVILFPCQGGAETYQTCTGGGRRGGMCTTNIGYNAANGFPNTWANLLNYTADGGRAFTTHYHYDLLDGNGSFTGTANWTPGAGGMGWNGPDTGYINQGVPAGSFARGVELSQWLNQPAVYGGTYGQIPVGTIRNDFSGVNAPAQLWMSMERPNPGSFPVHYTFDTPFGGDPVCGRVVYSDFHVENATNATGAVFPGECAGGGLTPQEKLLEFMLFDLTSCVSPPTCTPLTCANFPAGTCGEQGDGCGGMTANCLTCTAPQTCGGGGVAGQCGGGTSCVGETCAEQNISCGPAGNGCGAALSCGTCEAPQTCGGGGVPGKCGGIVGCTAKTCAEQKIGCGPAGDGCGNLLNCGECVAPQTCGGAGVPGQCGGGGVCTPETCVGQGVACGPAGDGCGNLLQCGTCVAPATCGGGGISGQCGSPGTAN